MTRDETSDQTLEHVGIRELRSNVSGILRRVRHGESFLITSHNQVLAELRPVPKTDRPRRQPGALRGKIKMAPDFDEWPPEILAAMLGDDE